MAKKETLSADTEFDEVDNTLPADVEFDEVDEPLKKKEPTKEYPLGISAPTPPSVPPIFQDVASQFPSAFAGSKSEGGKPELPKNKDQPKEGEYKWEPQYSTGEQEVTTPYGERIKIPTSIASVTTYAATPMGIEGKTIDPKINKKIAKQEEGIKKKEAYDKYKGIPDIAFEAELVDPIVSEDVDKETIGIYEAYLKENNPKKLANLKEYITSVGKSYKEGGLTSASKTEYQDALKKFNEEAVSFKADALKAKLDIANVAMKNNKPLFDKYDSLAKQFDELKKSGAPAEQLRFIADQLQVLQNSPEIQEAIKTENETIPEYQKTIQESANLYKKYPELAKEIDTKKAEQAAIDVLDEIDPQRRLYSNTINQVGKVLTGAAESVLSLPRTLAFNNEYGWTDKWAKSIEGIKEGIDKTVFYTPTRLGRGLIENTAKFKGYNLTIDKEGNVSSVRNDAGNLMGQNKASEIAKEYNETPEAERPKVEYNEVQTQTLLPKIISMGAEMAQLIGGGAVIKGALKGIGVANKISEGAGLFASSFVTTHNDYYKQALEAGIDNRADASKFAVGAAAITSALELVSPQKYLTSGVKSGFVKDYYRLLKDGATKKEAFSGALKHIAKEVGYENVQELSQLLGDKFSMYLANKSTGADIFDTSITLPEVAETVIMTSIVSGLPAIVSAKGTRNQLQKDALYTAAQDDVMPKIFSRINADLLVGKISESEAKEIKMAITEMNSAIKSMPEDAELSEQKKSDIANLILEKRILNLKKKEKDEVFHGQYNERIETIDNEIKTTLGGEAQPQPPGEAEAKQTKTETENVKEQK